MSTKTVPTPSDEGGRQLSLRQLSLLFVVALLLFCAMRWNSDQWLQQYLMPRLASNGIHASAVARDGGRLRLQNVTVDGVEFAGKPLQLEQLVVAPKWLALLQLQLTAEVSMRWQQATLNAELERVEDNRLAIRGLNMTLPLSMLTPMLPPMPVTLAGEVVCHGGLQLNVMQSRPEQLDVVCDWSQATATMGGGKPMPLGHYSLMVRSVGADWQWTLTGGDVAKVNGKGMVHPAMNVALSQWLLDGSLTVGTGKGALGAMVGAMLGAQAHAISGSLGAPVFR